MRSLLVDTTPLRVSPAFRHLWLGLSIGNLGQALTVVAVGLQVYEITGSTLSVGVLGLFVLVPLVVFGLYGGAIADAFDRRTVAFVASTIGWLVTIGIAVQAFTGNEHVGLLYGLVAVQSAANAVSSPARSAIIPRLLEPRLMPAANALFTIGFTTAQTLGPLLGAAGVAWLGYGPIYTIDVVLYTAALAALRSLPPVPPEGTGRALGLRSVLEGLRYLAGRPNVRMTFVVDLIAMITSSPRALFPAVGLVYLGGQEATAGVMSAAVAVGALSAGLFSGALTRIRWQARTIALAITVWGLAIAGFGLVLVAAGRSHPDHVVLWALALAALMLAVAGAGDAISSVFRQTILQTATPDDMRGRLQGIFIVVVAGGPRLGEVFLGATASRVGEGWAAVIGGCLCVLLLWIAIATQRSFWNYDARNPTP